MAKMYLTFKVMPESPDVDLEALKEKLKSQAEKLNGIFHSVDIKPVAFGLNEINITFMFDESVETSDVEDKFLENEEVSSVTVIDMRRAFG